MTGNESLPAGMELRREPEGLVLTADGMSLRADFSRLLPRLEPRRLGRELLLRATRTRGCDRGLRAADATAGLGEDSLLLAAAGFEVTLFERNSVIAALLADALERASREPELAEIVSRMRLVVGDGVAGLQELEGPVDAILLDPMFPAKRGSAAAKKKLQLLQRLEGPAAQETALLDAALSVRPRKVVIKRPLRGPFLAGKKPSYTLRGKLIRYDVIVRPC